jgi:hypothetical protein
MVNVVTLNYENSLDRFISEAKNVVYKTVLSKKLAGWVDGWVDGWVGGWMAGKAGLRIAYSNQKCKNYKNGAKDKFKIYILVNFTLKLTGLI